MAAEGLATQGSKASLPMVLTQFSHDDVIKWKHFPSNWPFGRGIHRSRWSPHTKASDAELWCFFFICAWINDWVNNRETGGLRRYRAHYDVIVMTIVVVNTLKPGQNKQNFAGDIFKYNFLNENVYMSVQISLKIVYHGMIEQDASLIRVVIASWPGKAYRITHHLCGESTDHRFIPPHRISNGSFDIYCVGSLNTLLNKQSSDWYLRCLDSYTSLLWIMAWCHQTTSHYSNQWWPCLLTHIFTCNTRSRWVKTHWGRDKMDAFRRRHFQMHFLERKCLNSDQNFIEFYS